MRPKISLIDQCQIQFMAMKAERDEARAKLEIAREALREISEWGGPVAGYGLMELAEEALEKIK